jgi:hypothetical protein
MTIDTSHVHAKIIGVGPRELGYGVGLHEGCKKEQTQEQITASATCHFG